MTLEPSIYILNIFWWLIMYSKRKSRPAAVICNTNVSVPLLDEVANSQIYIYNWEIVEQVHSEAF